MRIRSIALVASLLVASSTAGAQPAMTQPAAAPSQEGEVSPEVALALSLGGTVASYGAIGLAVATRSGDLGTVGMVGTFIAPSFGHWYSGKYVTRGGVLRVVGFATLIVGALADNEGCSLFYSGHGDPEPADCGEDFRTTKGTVLILAGLAMFAGGTVDDIVTAPGRARRHNDSLRVQPIVRADGGGLAIAGAF